MANQPKGAPAATKPASKEAKPAMRSVAGVATRMGYYGLKRVREGQPVTIRLAGDQQLPSWVRPADEKATPAAPAPDAGDGSGGGEGTGSSEPVI